MTDQGVVGDFDRGMQIRKEVLGAEHVQRSYDSATPFSKPMQDLVTMYCWGGVWARDGLERKTRSLLNIGILTALNRSHELGVHVRGAVRNGCTVEEIQEVLLQTAIYVGVPAAMEGFRIADATIASMQDEE